jgi:phosphate starvation-inducible protein PhoH and related proteins
MNGSLSLNFKNNSHLPLLYGERNSNLQFIEKTLSVIILSRGSYIAITGDDDNVRVAATALESLYHQIENGNKDLSIEDIKVAIKAALDNSGSNKSSNVHTNEYVIKTRKKTVFPYTDNQKKYLKLLNEKDMVFGVAVAVAVSLFLEKKVNKIILCRPAVEAGEKLGFLPGDIKDKVDPYLQPLYDSLYDMLPVENIERYMATKEIQIAPLAFMRGRTLSNAFVILDEAQNATPIQMKMFLTRLGFGSKMAITGDLTQIDLHGQTSGLIDAIEKLKHLKDVGVVNFGIKDCVRHPLTSKIIEAYEQG